MPEQTSDSYDPEFITSENADIIRNAIQLRIKQISDYVGKDYKDILTVITDEARLTTLQHLYTVRLTETDLRIIRFALRRFLESI